MRAGIVRRERPIERPADFASFFRAEFPRAVRAAALVARIRDIVDPVRASAGVRPPRYGSPDRGPEAAAARLRAFPPLLPLGARDQRRWQLRQYELMVIVDPAADEENVGTVVDRITQILTDRGGEVSGVDRWGRRKLAYEIDRKSEGYYVVLQINADPEILAELDRVLSVADEVLRFKVVRTAA